MNYLIFCWNILGVKPPDRISAFWRMLESCLKSKSGFGRKSEFCCSVFCFGATFFCFWGKVAQTMDASKWTIFCEHSLVVVCFHGFVLKWELVVAIDLLIRICLTHKVWWTRNSRSRIFLSQSLLVTIETISFSLLADALDLYFHKTLADYC